VAAVVAHGFGEGVSAAAFSDATGEHEALMILIEDERVGGGVGG
jgi:hypothetical protein